MMNSISPIPVVLRLLIVSGLALWLSGCANPVKTSSLYYSDTNLENAIDSMNETRPSQYLERQAKYLAVFAGCDPIDLSKCSEKMSKYEDAEWQSATRRAMSYYDGLCSNYLGYIYTRKKWNEEVNRNIERLDQPTRLVVGTLTTPLRAIQIMASAFGLSPALFNVADEGFITSTDMPTLMQLVRGVQNNFRTVRLTEAKDEMSTVGLIRDYAMICSPMGIDYEFSVLQKKAISDTFKPVSLGGTPGQK